MVPLPQMSQNQPLPVPVQHILAAAAFKDQSAARLPGLQQKMDLRIVAQGLKMAHALHSVPNRLLIYDTARAEFHRHAKALFHQIF